VSWESGKKREEGVETHQTPNALPRLSIPYPNDLVPRSRSHKVPNRFETVVAWTWLQTRKVDADRRK